MPGGGVDGLGAGGGGVRSALLQEAPAAPDDARAGARAAGHPGDGGGPVAGPLARPCYANCTMWDANCTILKPSLHARWCRLCACPSAGGQGQPACGRVALRHTGQCRRRWSLMVWIDKGGTVMRRTRATWMMVGAGLLGVMLLPMGATVHANCEAGLVGKTFQCQFKHQDGSTGTEEWKFVDDGLGEFELQITGGASHGCSCRATGNFNNPNFDQDNNAFLCVTATGPEALAGQVTGGGQITAEAADITGASTLFQCQEQAPITCPCEGQTRGDTTWSDAFVTTGCEVFSNGDVSLLSTGAGNLAAKRTARTCSLTSSLGSVVTRDISREEADACIASLRQISANDGVTCQRRVP